MATKRTQRSLQRIPPSLSPQPRQNYHQTSPEILETKRKNSNDPPKTKAYVTTGDHLYHPRLKAKAFSKASLKSKEVYIPCRRHNKEGIKYVDITPRIFEGICDTCMVRSEFFGKNLKLERLLPLYTSKWQDLSKACEDLQEIEVKIGKIYRDTVRENLKVQPLLKEIDDMEKKVTKEVERCFRKIKSKFIKYNPFKDTRELVKNYIDGTQAALKDLEDGTYQSFEMLRAMYVGDNKIITIAQKTIEEMNAKIEMDRNADPLQDREFGLLVYEYGRFFDKVTAACTNFFEILKVSA